MRKLLVLSLGFCLLTAPAGAAAAARNTDATCRVDWVSALSVRRTGGPIATSGHSVAVATVLCLDLMLESHLIDGVAYIEYLAGDEPGAIWTTVPESQTAFSAAMSRGVGGLPVAMSFSYPADHPVMSRPHRACIDLGSPSNLPPVCQVFLSPADAV